MGVISRDISHLLVETPTEYGLPNKRMWAQIQLGYIDNMLLTNITG
jgi:hypothetical protein